MTRSPAVQFTDKEVVNVATVPKRSPFRYPGGKTWLVPIFREWIFGLGFRPRVLVEPFAGGGIVSLTAVFDDLVDRAVMCEIDSSVASVWKTILKPADAKWLATQILEFQLEPGNVVDCLTRKPRKLRERAFQTILRNRVQRGGIMAPGAGLVKTGENGRGLNSRWYPETLARRILEICELRSRIDFVEADAFDVIPLYVRNSSAAFFVDPPYTAGGKSAGSRLYVHNSLDHDALFNLVSSARGPSMLTYDESEEIRVLARRHRFVISHVPMKNTHHRVMNELVLTRGYSQMSLSLV